MKINNFDKRIGEKLRDYKQEPPSDLFARIESSLAVEEGSKTVPLRKGEKPRNFSYYFLRYGVVAAAIVTIALTGYYLFDLSNNAKPVTVAEEIIQGNEKVMEVIAPQAVIDAGTSQQNDSVAEMLDNIVGKEQKGSRLNAMPKDYTVSSDIEKAVGENVRTNVVKTGNKVEEAIPEQPEDVRNFVPEVPKSVTAPSGNEASRNENAMQELYEAIRKDQKRAKRGGKFEGALYAGNTGLMGNFSNSGRGSDMAIYEHSNTMAPENPSFVIGSEESPTDNVPESTTALKHNMPLNVGASFSYSVSPKVAIVSGLSYSYLSSTFRQSSMTDYNVRRELHYIGIPLGVTYNFYTNNRFSLYVQGGGMLEKVIYARQIVETNVSGNTTREAERIKVGGVQPSVNAAVGAQVIVGSNVGIYVEPGVSYYFKETSQPENYRTAHPANFSLRMGVRFNW